MKIEIKGTQSVDLEGVNITCNADAKNETKGAIVKSKAQGVNTVKGSITKVG
jgi:hypothetical protein